MSESTKKGRESVSPVKAQVVADLVKSMAASPIVGVVNMENLPARQLSEMRSQLRGKVTLFMTKKKLIKIALKTSKQPKIQELEKYLKGMPAILLTDQNPFALYSLLKKKRSNAPMKAGQAAPRDITVKAGVTSFAPGPVIGELGSMKIKAGIEAGKVVIKEDKVVAKEGDIIDDKLSSLLLRLGIEPMEIGLALTAVYEKGEILNASVLDIDEEAYKKNFILAAQQAFNLAMFASIPMKETIELLLSQAHAESKAVAKEAKFMTSENVGELLAQAEAEAAAVQKKAGL